MNQFLSNLKHLVIPDLIGNLFLRHSPVEGNPINRVRFSNWIPASARMTKVLLDKVHLERSRETRRRNYCSTLWRTILVCLILTTFYLILSPSPALAATVTWDGGTSGGWNTAANWSNDIVPTSSDDVTIDNAAVTTSSNISFSTLTIGSGSTTSLTQNNKVQQTITGIYEDIN